MERNVILLSIILLSGLAAALEVVQAYETPLDLIRLPFSISTNSWTYYVGDPIVVTGQQQVNTQCDDLIISFKFNDENDQTRFSTSKDFGRFGYANVYYQLTQSSSALPPGSYVITASATCTYGANTYVLGSDGYADASTDPDYIYVTLYQRTPSSTPLPLPSCTKTCSPGYQLVDANSVSCYCNPAYTEGNGKCELGEPSVARDCVEEQQCLEGQVFSDGRCTYPPKQEDRQAIPLVLLVAVVGFLGGAALFLHGGRKKK